ncbi:MAG: hypothetical protein NZV61_02175 [Candidatus Bipolaricaulota bacterium]|nr:hypothetical protein [Candidatus Bipolaricaulota bacterium]
MNPTELIGPPSPLGYPAPYWFLVTFKVLGFTLHMGPMHLWFAGILLAMIAARWGGPEAQRWSARLMRQMPVIIALGINFGIVPLLFTQVAYYRVFYPATILMAWPWFLIIVLLTFAYYGVYLYVTGLKDGAELTPLKRSAGWVSAILFIVIGFLFSNGFSLMTNLHAWPQIWQNTSVAGAPLGTALNTSDLTLWPRWLMMFGLALTTVAAYTVFDAGVFAARESAPYKSWAADFALKLYTVGLLWFAVMGSWYVFGTWPTDVREQMFTGLSLPLTVLTAVGPGLPWLLILAQRQQITRALALLTALAQFGVLGLNAISRQIVQNIELSQFLDVTAEPVNLQLSPLIVFLVLFVLGLGVVAWMVLKVLAAERTTAGAR